jgi:hypothetical protein
MTFEHLITKFRRFIATERATQPIAGVIQAAILYLPLLGLAWLMPDVPYKREIALTG